MDWSGVAQPVIAAFLSSSVVVFIAGLVLKRRTEQISAEVKDQFERELLRYRSGIVWKEKALTELLGPVVMQLDRTSRAFQRWNNRNVYIESKVIYEGNKTIRDLLLTKGHLLPADLLQDAGRLVEHYDRWLEEYDRVRGGAEPKLDEPFVFVGPSGYPFPRDSEARIRERFLSTWRELYGEAGALQTEGASSATE